MEKLSTRLENLKVPMGNAPQMHDNLAAPAGSRFGNLNRESSPPIRRKRRFEEFGGPSLSPEPKKPKREMPAWLQDYMKNRAKAAAGEGKKESEDSSKKSSTIWPDNDRENPSPPVVQNIDGYNLKRKAPVLKTEKKNPKSDVLASEKQLRFTVPAGHNYSGDEWEDPSTYLEDDEELKHKIAQRKKLHQQVYETHGSANVEPVPSSKPKVQLSPEEMQRLLIRNTTQILLEVTDNLIIQVATETICEFQDALSKRKEATSALDDALKQAQTKLAKQKLKNAGLGAYGSDDSEDESEPPPVEVKKPSKRTVVIEKNEATEKNAEELTKEQDTRPSPEPPQEDDTNEALRSVSGERISVSGERSPSPEKTKLSPRKEKKKKKKKKKRESKESSKRRSRSRDRSKKKKSERRRGRSHERESTRDRDRRRRRRRSRD